MRYTRDGRPDPGFGTNGIVRMDFTGSGDVALDSAGRMLVVGREPLEEGSLDVRPMLVRLRPGGALDSTFGDGGKVHLAAGNATAVLADGRRRALVVGGDRLVRLTTDGRLDETFGEGGTVRLAHLQAAGAALQANGSILVGGAHGRRGVLLRLGRNEAVDRSFGRSGRISFQHRAAPTRGRGCDGPAGRAYRRGAASSGRHFILARVQP